MQFQKQKDKNSLENITEVIHKERNHNITTKSSLDKSLFTNIRMRVVEKENERLEYLNKGIREEVGKKEKEISKMAKNMFQEPV